MLIENIQQHHFSSFSPGFWIYTGNTFKIDEQIKKIFNFTSNEIELEDFLNTIDKKSADFLRTFFSSSKTDMLNIKFTRRNNTKNYFLMQGSVVKRDENQNTLYCSGYCIELQSKFSVPRVLHSTEFGEWDWNGLSGECQFCDNYHLMLGYNPTDNDFPNTFEEWVNSLVHPDDLDAIEFQRQLLVNPDFGDKFECSVRLKHKDGHYVWTIGKGFVTQRNHLGHAISLYGTNQSLEIIKEKYENALQKISMDPLTRTYTRDFFSKKWKEIQNNNSYPISFLYIDICYLKMVNDILGHDVGDEMILKVIEIIDKTIQMPKFIIRMGGDEFLIILPNCTSELAAACIKNLLKSKVHYEEENKIPAVFAIGKSLMTNNTSLKSAITHAEREMQKNKENSRREDRAVLQSFIENVKKEKVEYHDTRI